MLAGNAGFTFDEVEDVRIGVNEACVILVGQADVSDHTAAAAPQGRLEVDVADAPGLMRIALTRSPALTATRRSELSTQILEAVVDSFEFESDDSATSSLRLTKRHVATN